MRTKYYRGQLANPACACARMRIKLLSSCLLVTCLLLAGTPIQAGMLGLVANGDFEEPTGAPDFPPWVLFGDTLFSVVGNTNPLNGAAAASFGPTTPGGIYQDLPTVAGTQYVITFWLANTGDTPNSFRVEWEGTSLFLPAPYSSGVNLPFFDYTQFSFVVTATSTDLDPLPAPASASRLRFTFEQPNGFFDLDDVSVSRVTTAAVPEPASLTIWSLGALALGLAARRRQRAVIR